MQQFLYLAKRDKKGIILLSYFEGQKVSKTLIKDISEIGLSEKNTKIIQDFYKKYHMDYQIVFESAEDFKSLKQRLLEKGFINLPSSNQAKFNHLKIENPKNLIKMQKIMLQKRNDLVN